VLVDEAHVAFKSVFQWMHDAPELPFVGLSATPWTKGLGRHYDDLIVAATTAQLIEQRYLSPFRVFAPSEPDLSAVRTVAGDYHEGELGEAMNTPQLVGDAVVEWQARGENRPTFAFAVNRAHALHLSQRFREVGIPCAYIDCNTELADREAIFQRFRAGDVRIIANVNTLTVGIDLDVRCIIDARPTKSEMRYVQTIGRGLRNAPGKDHLIIIDHSGNVQRLGRVTDIHHDKLNSGKERGAVAERKERPRSQVRVCEECKAVIPPRALACEACGLEIESKTDIVHVDGDLVELGTMGGKSAPPSLMDQAEFFAEVKFVAREKGFAPGWAAHKFKDRFGHWPNAPLVRLAEPQEPGLKTKNWLKSRAIAYARRRANG
jgi:DNA repair protein RadD